MTAACWDVRCALPEHEVQLLEVGPAELGSVAPSRPFGNPGGRLGACPYTTVGRRAVNRLIEFLLMSGREHGRTPPSADCVLIHDRIRPLVVVALDAGADSVAMEADKVGHLADRPPGAEEPQGVPTARLFRVATGAVALFQRFRAQVRCQGNFRVTCHAHDHNRFDITR